MCYARVRFLLKNNISVNCGWGKLLFAQTFSKEEVLCRKLMDEDSQSRNIGIYVEDAHIITSQYPQELFIDPSHTYRKELLTTDTVTVSLPAGIQVRKAKFPEDREQINTVYVSQQALELPESYRSPASVTSFVAVQEDTQQIVGVCMWIDHNVAFDDPEHGSSFWALAVTPSHPTPGIGLALVERCLQASMEAGCRFLDLSVLYSNEQAIALYERLGFTKTPWLSIKNKSPLNEKLFTSTSSLDGLNVRSRVILSGAAKRGISYSIVDPRGFFDLTLGGKTVSCYESLTDLTSAIGLKRCDNHNLTNILLRNAELSVPDQEEFLGYSQAEQFLQTHDSIVTKVLRGTKFQGTTVNIQNVSDLKYGIKKAQKFGDRVLLEQSVSGERLRLLIINYAVVAALRVQEPFVIGTGKHTVRQLIQKLNRRQSTQYDDMRIPIDKELRACLRERECDLDTIPPEHSTIPIRKFASAKTGEFLEPVAVETLQEQHVEAAQQAARVLQVPVVDIEMKVSNNSYFIFQANERPSLAPPHDQLVVDAFLDFLFPQLLPTEV